MQLAISNIAWDSKDNNSIYTLMKKYSFNGLEIAPTKFFPESPYDKTTEIEQLKKELNSLDLEVISMQSILFGRNDLTLFETKEKRKNLLEYLKKGIVFANRLGIKNIVFGNPKNRITFAEADYKIGVEFFRELGDFSKDYSVYIGIEANPEIYGGNFLTDTKSTIKYIEEINHPFVGLNFDLGTSIQNKENLEILKEIKEKITHVHISEPYLETISEENREIHLQLFKILREIDYKNFVSIEMKGYEKENIERIEKVLKYIKEISEGK